MTDLVKVLIAERNGVDLEDVEELDLSAGNVSLNNPDYVSDNVSDALSEALVGSKDIHASQFQIDVSENIVVESKKQMRVFQCLKNSGELTINGWLVVD